MSKKSKTNPATELKIEYLDCTKLVPDPRNSRQHNTGQLARLQAAITEFGFTAPIIIDEHNQIVAGHARHAVAKMMRLPTVPCVRIGYLTPAQKRALAIADNKLAELAEWDLDALRTEFASLCDLEFPLELTGFDTAEIDIILDFNMSGSERSTGRDDVVQPVDKNMPAVMIWMSGDWSSTIPRQKRSVTCSSATRYSNRCRSWSKNWLRTVFEQSRVCTKANGLLETFRFGPVR